ncbi:MAG: alpha/beta hydrolase-fold protein [Planctomycetaceae bacterium]|nr:alpha/beta hydrolase-fold protein [Planctomycetaceae bacterium]
MSGTIAAGSCIASPYQSGTSQLRVLLPTDLRPDERVPVIYVLPVEAGTENRYGDGLAEIQQQGLAAKHRVAFVAPTFSQLPWYADHPTDPLIRQETHLLKVVLPFIERTYPVRAERSGRLLLGFSKSGWGAWSLLLRHPDTFARAAAWDAPLMLDRPGKYGSGPIFGDDATFARYRVSDLVRQRAEPLRGEPRLILTGYGNFRDEHTRMHALLDELQIPHIERDGPSRKHDWHSGWVPEAVELLVAPQP